MQSVKHSESHHPGNPCSRTCTAHPDYFRIDFVGAARAEVFFSIQQLHGFMYANGLMFETARDLRPLRAGKL
jgi:hypothetical protein